MGGDDGGGGGSGRGRGVVDEQCFACGAHLMKKTDPWPGLPAGIRFEPSDQELLGHLVDKVRMLSTSLVDHFILTNDDVCHRHPEKLLGIHKDGTSTHYFHTLVNRYDILECKRQKIQEGEDNRAVSWQCVGGPQAILGNGAHVGFKKTMVLVDKKGRCKANWVRHQYHLGENEEEKEGELVVSKIVYEAQCMEGGDIPRQNEAKSRREACLASSQALQVEKMVPRDQFLKTAEVLDSFHTRLDKQVTTPDEEILYMLVPRHYSYAQSREGHRHGLYRTMAESANEIFTGLNPAPDSMAAQHTGQEEGSSMRGRSEAAIRQHEATPSSAHGGPGTQGTRDNKRSSTQVRENPSRLPENEISTNDDVQERSPIESRPMHMCNSLGPPPDYLLSTQEVRELEEKLAANDDWGSTQ